MGAGIIAASAAGNGGHNPVIDAVITILAVGAYWLPSLIAWRRHVPALGQVVIVNFFAFFFLVPWVIALVLAFRDPRPQQKQVSRSASG